jgi:hypothetical protein
MSSKIINKTMDRRDLFIPEVAAVVREVDRLIRELRANLLHPFFYRRVELGDLWRWKAEGLRAGQFPHWQFPLVKWWNDYTFGALFQEKVG